MVVQTGYETKNDFATVDLEYWRTLDRQNPSERQIIIRSNVEVLKRLNFGLNFVFFFLAKSKKFNFLRGIKSHFHTIIHLYELPPPTIGKNTSNIFWQWLVLLGNGCPNGPDKWLFWSYCNDVCSKVSWISSWHHSLEINIDFLLQKCWSTICRNSWYVRICNVSNGNCLWNRLFIFGTSSCYTSLFDTHLTNSRNR